MEVSDIAFIDTAKLSNNDSISRGFPFLESLIYFFMMKYILLFLLSIPYSMHCQLSLLDDEFDRTCNLYEWQNIQEVEGWEGTHFETYDVNMTEEGSLTLVPYSTAWFQNFRSTLLFKNVAGNFVFTTNVSATNRANNGIPGSDYSLAGAMLRIPTNTVMGDQDWSAGQEDYVFLALGFAATNHSTCQGCPGPHFEVKSTNNSNSTLNVSSIPVADATIRIAKVDNAVVVLYALPGEDFVVRQRYFRPDFHAADSLQVGLVSYTDYFKSSTYTNVFANDQNLYEGMMPDPSSNPARPFNPDIEAHFDFARFQEYSIPSHHVGDNYFDPADISDEELVAEFGYESLPSIMENAKIWKGNSNDWNNPANWSGGSIPIVSDDIIIPNCSCNELTNPIISSGSFSFRSIEIEAGATLTVQVGADVEVETFNNQGNIECEGEFRVVNN